MTPRHRPWSAPSDEALAEAERRQRDEARNAALRAAMPPAVRRDFDLFVVALAGRGRGGVTH